MSNVSVPLRGKDSHELLQRSGHSVHPLRWFPSPCGEKIVMNGTAASALEVFLSTFPSPCGEKIVMNVFSLFM